MIGISLAAYGISNIVVQAVLATLPPASSAEAVAEVPLADTAALVDVDTPEALAEVKAELERA